MKSTMNHPFALSPEERRQLFADGVFKFRPQPISTASPRVWRGSQEKPSGACAHHSCWKPAAEGMKLCKHHRDLNVMRQRRFAEARRLASRVLPVFFVAGLLALASSAQAALSPRFVSALIQVESSGRDHAVGDNGRAVGCLQIHPILVADVNGILARRGSSTRFTLADRFDRQQSVAMLEVYLDHYGRRLGRKPTEQDLARIWNGGPAGWKRSSTLRYWAKVSSKL
jgi:hypothetical protein